MRPVREAWGAHFFLYSFEYIQYQNTHKERDADVYAGFPSQSRGNGPGFRQYKPSRKMRPSTCRWGMGDKGEQGATASMAPHFSKDFHDVNVWVVIPRLIGFHRL